MQLQWIRWTKITHKVKNMKLNQNILADFFKSDMILPLNKDFKLGGTIDPREEVEVDFDGQTYKTVADLKGNWKVNIPAISDEQTVATICVQTKNRKQIIDNIRFGKVYLLSGQSNIEYRLKDEAHFKKIQTELRNNEYQDLYYYNVPQVDYINPDTKEVKPKEIHLEDWHKINAENCANMSAVGFYMIKSMRDNGLTGPLAVVDCFKGGTSASVWIKKEDLARDAELNKNFLVKYQEEIKGKTWQDFEKETVEYNQKVDKHNRDLAKYLKMHPDTSLSTAKNIVGHTPWPPPSRPDLFTRPCGLHKTMMNQVKYGVFNGMVWYQGENDTDRAEQYRKLLPLLIQTWRRKLEDPSLPIKLIQLPGYADYPKDSAALVRQVQLYTARKMPEVNLVSFVDGGEEHNIHPTNKKVMGERLGKICTGDNYLGTPYVEKVGYENNNLILIVARSEHLKLKQETIFEYIKNSQKYQIEVTDNNLIDNRIEIHLEDRPDEILYGYTNFPKKIGLYNELDYPVSPFRMKV